MLAALHDHARTAPGTWTPELRRAQRGEPLTRRIPKWTIASASLGGLAAADAWFAQRVAANGTNDGREPALAVLDALALDWGAGRRVCVLPSAEWHRTVS